MRCVRSTPTSGSIIAVGDGSGGASAINRYDEYGNPQGGSIAGRFGYTGQMWLPEIGLFYYKNRMYSPALGRFLQTDPIGPVDDANLYQYALNDPINNVDPLGLDAIIITGVLPPVIASSPGAAGIGPGGLSGPRGGITRGGSGAGRSVSRAPANQEEIIIAIQRAAFLGLAPPSCTACSATIGGSWDTSIFVTGRLNAGAAPYYFNGSAYVPDPLYVKPPYSNAVDYAVGCLAVCPIAVAGGIVAAPEAGEVLFARSTGILNRNNYARLGYSWKGSARQGSTVFRLAIGNKGWPSVPGLPSFPWHLP